MTHCISDTSDTSSETTTYHHELQLLTYGVRGTHERLFLCGQFPDSSVEYLFPTFADLNNSVTFIVIQQCKAGEIL